MKRRHGDAYTVYLAMTAAEWLSYSLASTVLNVYLATRVTDDPFQLTLLWTAFQTTTLLFEIPTGVVADVFSRRLSILIGFTLTGIAALVQGAFPQFALVLLGQVIWGIGFTFVSGARDAWIADEIGEERVGAAYMQSSQVGQVAYLIGIPIGTALGTVGLNLPIIMTGLLYLLLALSVGVFMPEEGFQRQRPEERESWRSLFATFGQGLRLVRSRTVLIAILVISAVYGLSSAGFDSLWTVNILENLRFPAVVDWQPVVWFGVLHAVESLLGLAGTEIARRKVDMSQGKAIVRALMILTGATAGCMIVFGLSRAFWLSVAVYCLSIALRTTSDPMLKTWINQNVESKVRATVLSMDAQVNSVGAMIGGPVVGAIGSALSLPAALVTTGLARVPVSLLFARLALGGRDDSAAAD